MSGGFWEPGGGGGLSEGDNRLTNRHKRKGNKDEGGIRVALSGMNPLACLFSCELQASTRARTSVRRYPVHVCVRSCGVGPVALL